MSHILAICHNIYPESNNIHPEVSPIHHEILWLSIIFTSYFHLLIPFSCEYLPFICANEKYIMSRHILLLFSPRIVFTDPSHFIGSFVELFGSRYFAKNMKKFVHLQPEHSNNFSYKKNRLSIECKINLQKKL